MDNQELRTLQLLEEIENNQVSSQRDLARRMNISLGLVNAFIRRMANKGYFKITTIPRNRVKYILTPKGAAEKTRLTYEYIKYSYEFYKGSRQKLRKLFRRLEAKGVRRVVFYGAGDMAEIAYLSLQETGIELAAVADDGKAGKRFLGKTVLTPSDIKTLHFDRIILTASGANEEVLDQLSSQGISRERVALLE
jgi:DNA-binding MarR family transcriptional regulator